VRAPTGLYGPGERVRLALSPYMQEWAGFYLSEVTVSGSYAKQTAVRGDTDVDLFVSLKDSMPGTLADLYRQLGQFMQGKGFSVRWQNVSVGITYRGLNVDLVPGRKQSPWTSDHSIYVSKRRTWTKTNVGTHIKKVRDSGRQSEICLLKRWRDVHRFEFPSFVLELATLRALSGHWTTGLAANFLSCLTFFRDQLPSAALLDPANTNNNVADDMTFREKQRASAEAGRSLREQYWENIVW
jgi:hypothetical protein